MEVYSAAVALVVALAALRFTLFASTGGWDVMGYIGSYLAIWLPLVSLTTLVMLFFLRARMGMGWTGLALVVLSLGGMQFLLFVLTHGSRASNSFLPFVLLILSIGRFLL